MNYHNEQFEILNKGGITMKLKLIGIVLTLCFVGSGCGMFVPKSIKRETSLARIDLENVQLEAQKKLIVADKEVAIADELAKSEKYEEASVKYKQAVKTLKNSQESILRSYKRASKSIRNVENYMYRREPDKENEEKISEVK